MIKLLAPTTDDRVQRVLSQGLRKSCDLTDDFEFAQEVAFELAEMRDGRPAILEVAVDERDLRVQWEAYEDPPAMAAARFGAADPDEWMDMHEQGLIPFPTSDTDWRKALDTVLWVCHPSPIPPDRIRVVYRETEEGKVESDIQDRMRRALKNHPEFEHPESEV